MSESEKEIEKLSETLKKKEENERKYQGVTLYGSIQVC